HGLQPLFGLYAVDRPALAVVDHVCVVQLDTGLASLSDDLFPGHQYSLSFSMRATRISDQPAVKPVLVDYLDLRVSDPVVTSKFSRRRFVAAGVADDFFGVLVLDIKPARCLGADVCPVAAGDDRGRAGRVNININSHGRPLSRSHPVA